MINFIFRLPRYAVFSRFNFNLRFLFFKYWNGTKTINSENAFKVTVSHNVRQVGSRSDRMNLLIRPLSILENVTKNAKILVIGPRNEWDLILLWQAGFDFDKITGLDLISYSPKVVLGDMHKIPFNDDEFDVVLCGWTLSYSANPDLACLEISRVCKNGGIVGIGVEYCVISDVDQIKNFGYVIQEKDRLAERINSVDKILSFFSFNKVVYFNHDAPLKRNCLGQSPSNCCVLFKYNKADF